MINYSVRASGGGERRQPACPAVAGPLRAGVAHQAEPVKLVRLISCDNFGGSFSVSGDLVEAPIAEF